MPSIITVFTLLQWLWAQPIHTTKQSGDLPRDVNVAIGIAIVAAETDHPKRWAAALDTWAAFETAYHDRPGDCHGLPPGSPECTREHGAQSCGYWQTPCRSTPKGMSIVAQARQALELMQRSERMCPDFAMSVYASGVCAPYSAHIAFRMREIRAMIAVPLQP